MSQKTTWTPEEQAAIMKQLSEAPFPALSAEVKARGWVMVPRAHAEKAFPKEAASGWWPKL